MSKAKKAPLPGEKSTTSSGEEFVMNVRKDVPIPPRTGGGAIKYHWDKLEEVGDYVFVESAKYKTIYASIKKFQDRQEKAGEKPWKFTIRNMVENAAQGVGVWRIGDDEEQEEDQS
ncbi:MAG: hypothetical protein JJ891_06755 [Rhizobiaceae bacterium]|nr:hypothetical protein [Rhizobiaceae bacterium]